MPTPIETLGQLFAKAIQNTPATAAANPLQPGRLSSNIDLATAAQQAAPTLAELTQQFVTPEGHRYPTPYVSNWDVLHKRHLMDPTPVAQQDAEALVTDVPEVLSQQIRSPEVPEMGFVQNPGTFIRSQDRNRHLVSNAAPAQLPPGAASAFSGAVLPVVNPPETVFRPGLRYAPWNLRRG